MIESYGRCEDCLNAHWFASLEDAQQKIDAFRWDYKSLIPPILLVNFFGIRDGAVATRPA